MKKLYYLTFICFGILSGSLSGQNAPSVTIGSGSTYNNTFTAQISVTNYNGIGSGNLSLSFNPAIATILTGGIVNNPGLGVFGSSFPSPGIVRFGYFSFPCLSLPDNTVIISITFTKVASGTTPLTFVELPGDGFSDCSYEPIPQIPFQNFYTNGSISFLSDTDAPKTYLPTLTNQCPGAISVPVTVNFFNAIKKADLRMTFNAQAMTYSSFTNNSGFPGLSVTNPSSGVIVVSGSSTNPAGESMSNGSTFFTLNFNYTGGSSNLEWDDNGTSCQYEGINAVLNDTPTGSFYFNGAVQCTTQVPVWTTQPGALDVFLPCNDLSGLPAALSMAPSASAACSMTVDVSPETDVITPGPCSGVYTRVRTWSAKDKCNNTAIPDFTQTITVGINTPPAQPAPAGSTVQCVSQAVAPTPPTIYDQCGNPIVPGSPQIINNPNPLTCQGTRQYVYTYNDCANNQVTWTYTYNISLGTPPSVPANGGSTVQCLSLAVPPSTPIVYDACGRSITPVLDNVVDNLDPEECSGTRTYFYEYIDCANNKSSWHYTYTILLTSNPPVPADGGSTVECVAAAVTPQTPPFTDFCGRSGTPDFIGVVYDPNPVTCTGTVTYSWEVTDCASNTSVWKYVYTILRSTPPAETGNPVPASTNLQCISGTPPPPSQLPVVKDVCGTTLSHSGAVYDASGFNGCQGQIKYKYTYTDCQNLQFVWTYTYNIYRTVPPTEIGGPVPNTVNLECATGIQPPAQLPVVHDVCGNTLTASGPSYDNSGYNGCEGTIKYIYTYTDCASLQFIWTYTYNISHTVPPAESGGPVTNTLTVSCPGDAVPPTNLPVVKDVCGVTLNAPLPSIGGTFVDCEGTITYTYNYLDCDGLPFNWVFTYNVVRSGSNPPTEIGGPVPVSAVVACSTQAVPPQLPVVKDECGITLTPSQPVKGGTWAGCEGTITYTYKFTDCKGLIFNWLFTYTVQYQDFTLPVNAGSVVSCPDATDVVPNPPTVYDNCNVLIVPTGPIVSNKPTCSGTRTYTWTYTDCDNNSHDWTYTYTVQYQDFTLPQNAGSIVSCPDQTDVVPTPPAIYDNCNVLIVPTGPNISIKPTCNGTRTYTWTYTDCAQNSHDWTYTYTVQYQDFTLPQNSGSIVSCPDQTDIVPTPPTVYDNCNVLIVPTGPIAGTKPTCNGTRTYTFTYTDCAQNSHDWVYTYTVQYSGGLTAPADGGSTVACLSQATDPGAPANIADACGRSVSAQLVAATYNPSPLTCEGEVIWTYRYTACDNITIADWKYTYAIIYQDFTIITPSGGSVVSCPDATDVVPTPPTVFDNCGFLIVPNAPVVSQKPTCNGTRTYTWTYTDCAQNSHNWTYTYTIQHQDFTLPQNNGSTVSCPDATDVIPIPPTVYDNCNVLIVPSGPVVSAKPTCNGTRTYTFTFTDCAQNSHDWTYTYNVIYPGGLIPPQPGFATIACKSLALDPGPPPAIPDDCGRTVLPVLEGSYTVPDPLTCAGTVIWLYSYTSCDGITKVYWSFTYTVQYQNFTITQQSGSSVVNCPDETDIVPIPPVVHDNCGVTLIAVGPSDSGKPACNGTRNYTWTYTDCAQNSHDWVFTYTVLYSGNLTAPPDDASTVTCLSQAVDPGAPANITDACGRTVSAQLVGVVFNPDPFTCEGQVIWTYRYTACDNTTTADWKYTYTVDLAIPPTVPVNGGSTVECLADITTPQPPAVTDACGNTLTAVLLGFTDNPPQITCEGTRAYNFSYTDCIQNTSYWSYIYTIDITTPPVVPVNGSQVVATVGLAVPPVTPSVTDKCGNSVAAQFVSVIDNPNPILTSGTRVYTYEYKDCANNTSTWTFTYTIDPSMAPPIPPDGSSIVACVADAAMPSPPAYTDVCSLPVTPVFLGFTDVPSPITCEGTRVYEWSYTDCNSYTQYWKYTYTILYQDFGVNMPNPGGSVVSCPDQTDIVPTPPAVYDKCNVLLVPNVPIISTKPTCTGVRTYTWTYTDCDNNSHDWVYTYTVTRTTPPSEKGNPVPTSGGIVECISSATPPIVLPVVEDVCGTILSPTPGSPLIGGTFNGCEGTYTYTFTYIDCANLTYYWTYTYQITRTTPPSETGTPVSASGGTVECISSATVPTVLPIVKDVCGNVLNPTQGSPSQGGTYNGCEGTRTYTYQYIDCVGKIFNWIYSYQITRTIPPAESGTPVSTSGGIVECISSAMVPTGLPIVKDVCGNILSPTQGSPIQGGTYNGCEGTRTYTYQYIDCAGKTFNWIYSYQITRTTPPAESGTPVSTSGGIVECISSATVPTVLPVVKDVCGNILNPTQGSPVQGGTYNGCEGTRTYTYQYIDCAGKTFNWVYSYQITRTTPPAESGTPVSTSGGIIECISSATVPTVLPVVKDVCGSILSPTQGSPAIGGTYNGCEGTYTYTYQYIDCAGKTFSWTYSYQITRTTAPAETGTPVSTSGGVVECISSAIVPTVLPVVKDICDNILSPTPASPIQGGTYNGCEGTRTYTYQYIDCSGKTFNWIYSYQITRTTPPSESGTPVSTGGGIVECISSAIVPTVLPVVKDVCGNILIPAPGSPTIGGTYNGCEGTRTFTYHYIDCAGKTFNWTYSYQITRTTPPAETGTPVSTSGGVVECISSATAPTVLPEVRDVCGTVLNPIQGSPAIGGTYNGCEGTRTFIYQYIDCAGKTFNWTYTYEITRTTPPSETGTPVSNSGGVVECISSATVPIVLPVVMDVCGNILSPTQGSPIQGGTYNGCEGTRTYTYQYIDCDGKTFDWTYSYTIDLTTPPAVPGNGTLVVATVGQAVPPPTPLVSDACGNSVTVQFISMFDTPYPIVGSGTRVYTYAYKDCANNTSPWTFTYTIDPSMAPPLPPDGSSTVACVADATMPNPPPYTDVCNLPVTPVFLGFTDVPSPITCEGTRVYEWSYTDCNSYTQYWKYTYTIHYQDFAAKIPNPGGSVVSCPDQTDIVPTPPAVYDNCNVLLAPGVPGISTKPTCTGTRTYTWTYTDCDNNSHDWTYTYTIQYNDFTLPQNAGSIVSCPDLTDIVPTPPAVYDNCNVLIVPTGPIVSSKPTCNGTRTYIWTYTDCDNNSHDWTYTYTVQYNDFTLPQNAGSIVSCPDLTDVVPSPPAVYDNCNVLIVPTGPIVSTKPTCNGIRTYTWTYKDCASNSHNWVYTYNVTRTTPPAETGTPVSTNGGVVECISSAPAPAVLPVVKDVCGNILIPTQGSPVIGGTYNGCEGSYTYTYHYIDCANLTYSWTYGYQITRTTQPAETGTPVSINGGIVECVSSAPAPTVLPVVKDVCGNILNPTQGSPAIGGTYNGCEGTYTYTYNYIDCAGKVFNWTYSYQITRTTPPAETGNPVSTSGGVVECISSATAPTVLPVVEDVCGTILNPTQGSPTIDGSFNGCEGTRTYTYHYIDCANKNFDWTYIYQITHLTPPAETGTPVSTSGGTVECVTSATAPSVLPVVEDVCGKILDPTPVTPTIGGTYNGCEGTYTYTYHYIDCANLTYDWTYTYSIDLATPPVLSPNAGAIVPLVSLAVPPATPVVTDACGNTLTAVLVSMVDQPDPITTTGVRVYTYQYIDCAQNSSVWTFTYVVDPSTIPVFPPNGGSIVQCPSDAVMPLPPVYIDLCSQLVNPVYLGVVDAPSPIVCEGTRSYSWSYTDCQNQTKIWTYNYTIDLSTPPAVPADGSATVQCLVFAIAPTTPLVTDHCGRPVNPVLQSVVNIPQPLNCEGSRVYTYAYKDCAQNTSLWKFTYTIDRTTPPAPVGTALPNSSVVNCYAQVSPPAQLPVVKDACGATLNPAPPVIGGTYNGCEGTITYSYTYSDCSSLQYQWVYTYTVVRTASPAVPQNGYSVVECIADAVVPSTPVVFDQCGNQLVATFAGITYSPDPLVCEGSVTYNYSYTDCAHKTSLWSYTYTIDINTLPVVPASGNSTVPFVSMAVPPATPTVTDACGNSLTAQLVSVVDNPDPLLVSGMRVFTYNFIDCAGNTSTWTYTYTVDPNLIPPFPVDGGSLVECPSDAVMPVPPPYIDVCNNQVMPVFDGVTSIPDPVSCNGSKVYSFSYTDCLNQVFTWKYTYTVNLTIPPVAPQNGLAIVSCPADAIAPTLPVVEDHCGNTLTATPISVVDSPDPLACNGTRTYLYQFTDCASNTVNWSFTYTITRVTPPAEDGVPVSSTGVAECIIQAVPPTVLPVVKDACGNILLPSSPVSGGNFNGCYGTRSYTYTYTDCANLQFVWTYTWNILITTPPALPADGGTVVECVSQATTPVPPQVMDVCGNPLQPVLFNVSNSPFPLTCQGQRTYTFSYTDCAFNTVYWNYVYTIQRTVSPGQTGVPVPDQANVECVADAIPPALMPVVTDVCGVILSPGNPVTGGTYVSCSGTVTYTYNYVDCAGIPYQWVFTYNVNDLTPPAISCLTNQQRTLASGQTMYLTSGNEFDPLSFSDNCGFVVVTNSLNGQASLNGFQFPVGITNVVWTATDQCGNFTTCSFNIEILSLTYSGCVDLKAFLQGPFDQATGLMSDSLRAKNFIPVTEPYSQPPYSVYFTHTGGGGGETILNPAAVFGVTGPNATVDWVFVELRDKNDSSLVLYTRSALIQRDGDVVGVDGVSLLCFTNMPDNQYYVALRHRNHLGIMTAAPVLITPAGTVIDFRYGQQPEFDFGTTHPNGINYTGLAQKQVTLNTRAMFAGNANFDSKLKYQGAGNERGTILSQVLNFPGNIFLESNYSFAFGYFSGDTNLDGLVKYQGVGNDAAIILNNVINYTTGSSQSYDFMIEQLP